MHSSCSRQEVVEKDTKILKTNKEDALVCCEQRRLIRKLKQDSGDNVSSHFLVPVHLACPGKVL